MLLLHYHVCEKEWLWLKLERLLQLLTKLSQQKKKIAQQEAAAAAAKAANSTIEALQKELTEKEVALDEARASTMRAEQAVSVDPHLLPIFVPQSLSHP